MKTPGLETDPDHRDKLVQTAEPTGSGDAATEGEVVPVSVLFADLRGFTAMAEDVAPRHMAALLNDYLTVMIDVILERHGVVQDFVGDGILAVFGVPSHDPEHAWHAAVSAVEMQAALRRHHGSSEAERRVRQPIGVSMHSGQVFAGAVGSPRKWKYGVVGDTVNVASRLEELNRYLGTSILMSGQMQALLSDRVEARRRGWFPVRGRINPVEVYELLAVRV
jgi:adenylate cyclase